MALRLLGVDFTSAPRKKKPILCAWGALEGAALRLESFEVCESFDAFHAALTRDEQWVGAFDLPFGLPQAFVQEQGWPAAWRRYTEAALAISRNDLVARCRAYANARPPGQKLAYRKTDKPAQSSSAMWWMNPPVVLMYHAGVRCLLDAKVCMVPVRRTRAKRLALEGYPGLLQKRLGIGPYKQDMVSKQTLAQRENRRDLLSKLAVFAPQVLQCETHLTPAQRRNMIDDASGDTLDAYLCLLQAAYAAMRSDDHFGLPKSAPRNEGWIVMA